MQSGALLQRHLLIRRDRAPWPFLWRGLLPTLALALLAAFALGPVARHWIQDTVAGEIRAQLDRADLRWVNLTVSGQEVVLSGEAANSDAGERAMVLARNAGCSTWIGRRACATQVSGAFTVAPPIPATVPAAEPLTARSALACERSLASVLGQEEIRFARDSAAISPTSGALLDRLAHEIGACPGNIRVEGYTDSAGRPAANRALSRARAEAVRAALIARGVAAGRLEARGFGSAHPLVSNHSARGRARNRRIELHALAAKAA
jgi:outer membrane protein OmpA-like peptidoglycan-associated protein